MIGTVRNGALIRSGLLSAHGLERWLLGDEQPFKLWLLFVLEHWARQWLLGESERVAA
jgi:hypothetical protein